MRYVVVVKTDEYVRVFGTFSDKDRAERLAARVNELALRAEERDFQEWLQRTNDVSHADEMAPGGHGRAVVLRVHAPRIKHATSFALGSLEAI